MEESNEVHSEENKTSFDNKKRVLKTPAQLTALEKFYNEHKYPTEEMKSQLAEELGLSEKQISGWFCHRRLKDKRLSRDETYANGRQDRSSGVIQDRASGLGQDSCGSTKHGDYRYVDPREVESRRLSGYDFPPADLTREHRIHYTERVSMDNTSSESSSSLQDRFLTQTEDPYDMETSRYITDNGVFSPLNTKGAENMGYKPSGYLKVKGEIENAAITAVKRQLGRHFREDGPPLGVEFDPLPPGAFESPIMDPVQEPSIGGDAAGLDSPDTSGVKRQPSPSTRYEVYNSKLSSQGLYMHQENRGIMHGVDMVERKSRKQLRQKSTYLKDINSSAGKNSSLDMYDAFPGGMSAYNGNRKNRMSSKHGHRGRKITSETTEPWSNESDKVCSPNIGQRSDYFKSKALNSVVKHSETHDTERGLFTMIPREEKVDGECKAVKDYHNPLRVTMTDEVAVGKQGRVNFPHQDYATSVPFSQIPERKNQIKGTAMEMPSSFSEDETAETNSSVD
ncbi:putative transcription factor Homobox-WOX family [Rosa chinensis]|uniref:Putative transcription factor Homobox-WOX family n=1 Tax=Rosa chinensis TaxID=74649 RepID=A0A2P6QF75_ROSCH|nr:uncharacterized protein LOC112202888 [Rosa chinensis]PRQ32821.1 putative transcription factor Homobox-WOX family [Rosa chinensis]